MQNTIVNYPSAGNDCRFSRTRAFCLALLLLFAFGIISPSGFAQQSTAPSAPGSNQKTNAKTSDPSIKVSPKVTETLIDASIPDDPDILKMLEPYRAPVRELDVVIGRLEGDLRKGRVGAGSLGNFVTDGLRAEASRKLGKPVVLMVTNGGGMRKNSFAEGEIRVRDIFELAPFENSLISVDLTGEQLLKVLNAVIADRDAQSGAHITYRFTSDSKPEFVSAKLVDARGREQSIKPKAIYRVVTIDYLYNLKSGRYSILREGKNMMPVGITLRQALLNYISSETAKGRAIRSKIDNRFTAIGPIPPEAPPQ